jgi:hypothetical protein
MPAGERSAPPKVVAELEVASCGREKRSFVGSKSRRPESSDMLYIFEYDIAVHECIEGKKKFYARRRGAERCSRGQEKKKLGIHKKTQMGLAPHVHNTVRRIHCCHVNWMCSYNTMLLFHLLMGIHFVVFALVD